MALAPEQKLTYKEGGPAAEARFEAGVAGYEARAFRGCGVFTSEPFEVSDGAHRPTLRRRTRRLAALRAAHRARVRAQTRTRCRCSRARRRLESST
jgi:hypothetical protein